MFFILLLALCITFETAAPKTFKVVNKDRWRTYWDWRDICRMYGRLARIENAEDQREAEAVLAKYRGLRSVFVDGVRGGGSKSKTFYYADFKPISYANWRKGEPNNLRWIENCIVLYVKSRKFFGKWKDAKCGWAKAALCEKIEKKDRRREKEGLEGETDLTTFKVVYKDRSDRSPKTLPNKCRRLNRRLARIENAEKQKKVELFLSQFYGLHAVLVDGQRGGGSNWRKFYSSDGTPIRYTNWNKGEPNDRREKCIEVLAKDNDLFGKWNDFGCSKPWAALCEI